MAVLPLNATQSKLDEPSRSGIEEDIRSTCGDVLTPLGYTVLTGETTLQKLKDNGVDENKVCEANCALAAAKEIQAALFIAGIVTTSEGEHVAFVRLFESETGRQLSSVRLEGTTAKELRKSFEEQAPQLFQRAGLTSTTQSTVAPPPVPPARSAPTTLVAGRYGVKRTTVADVQTGLVWQREVAPEQTWNDASSYCARLDRDKRRWRLPTRYELDGLVDRNIDQWSIRINAEAFPRVVAAYFWTADTERESWGAAAWTVNFLGGGTMKLGAALKNPFRCVSDE